MLNRMLIQVLILILGELMLIHSVELMIWVILSAALVLVLVLVLMLWPLSCWWWWWIGV